MKTFIPFSIAAALAASGISQAQTTPTPAFSKPSGYETAQLNVGFNLVGMRLVDSAVASGVFTSNTGTTLVDSTKNFTLDANVLYLVEFNAGSLSGLIVEAMGSSFAGNTLSGLAGITADYLVSYSVRPARTIGQTFGSGSSVLLSKGTPVTADTILIPNSSGGFDLFYHSADIVSGGVVLVAGGWRKVGGGSADQVNFPINYLDAFFVQVKATPKSLTITGQVKTNSTILPTPKGFSYLSSIYPAGSTLGSSGLAATVKKGTPASADLLLLPKLTGGFDLFYHSADIVSGGTVLVAGSWQQVGGGSASKANQPLTSAYIFQRRGEGTNMPFSPPSFYSNL